VPPKHLRTFPQVTQLLPRTTLLPANRNARVREELREPTSCGRQPTALPTKQQLPELGGSPAPDHQLARPCRGGARPSRLLDSWYQRESRSTSARTVARGDEQLSSPLAPGTVPHSRVNDTPPAAGIVGTRRLPTRGR
jgi:hypothetical protein